jgi:phosphate transport system protein
LEVGVIPAPRVEIEQLTKDRGELRARDDEIDRLYHRVFDDLISDMSSHEGVDPDEALRTVTLMLVAHNLERIGDRVTNVAEDIVFLETGQVVELG